MIIGFSYLKNKEKKRLYTNNRMQLVDNINAYLIDAPNIFIEKRSKPIQNVPKMDFGNMPNDGGFLCNYTDIEKNNIVSKYPIAKKMFKNCIGAEEFINNKTRYCLWLQNVSPNEIKLVLPVLNAVQKVKELRLKSNREATRNLADTPYLFGEIRQPDTNYLLVPSTSSEKRKYIPMGFFNKEDISTNANLIIPNATLFHFGILESNVHMAWIRAVCGRLKSDYRYSAKIVYNNFPWCSPTDEQKEKIEKTAQGILDARALYPDCSLADLYDELTMPIELRKAHQENDKMVMSAYGFKIKDKTTGKLRYLKESETVAGLMQMYKELTRNKSNA